MILSSSGLKNIVANINNEENEFILSFGDSKIRMSKINADFISPLISHLHILDPTLVKYQYPKDDSMNEIFTDEIISFIDLLSRGESIEINESQGQKLQQLSILLGNQEIYSKINELFPPNVSSMQIKGIIQQLSSQKYLMRFNESYYADYSDQIKIIAQNFYKIDTNDLKNLPFEILLSIIRSNELMLPNEDFLLDFIYEIFKSESISENGIQIDQIEFFEEVEFSFLTKEKLLMFAENINVSLMTQGLWKKLKKCLFMDPKQSCLNSLESKRYVKPLNIEYNGKKEGALKGIIYQLTKKFGGNVSDKKVVNITSSSNTSNSLSSPKYAADFENKDTFFGSSNFPNSWIKYDFKNRRVCPTHYSLSHTFKEKGWSHPVQWVIEGSNTDRDDDWKELDSRSNINEINGAKTFKMQRQISNESYQYLRLRQTGPSSLGGNYLNISALEYFGSIIDK